MTIPRSYPPLAVAAVSLTACISATPVVAVPATPEESASIRSSLIGIGSCDVTSTQDVGGAPKDATGVHMSFLPNGRLQYHMVTPFGDVDQSASWELDGKNIKSDGIYKTMRADGWGATTLKLFIYDLSQTYYCTKKRA